MPYARIGIVAVLIFAVSISVLEITQSRRHDHDNKRVDNEKILPLLDSQDSQEPRKGLNVILNKQADRVGRSVRPHDSALQVDLSKPTLEERFEEYAAGAKDGPIVWRDFDTYLKSQVIWANSFNTESDFEVSSASKAALEAIKDYRDAAAAGRSEENYQVFKFALAPEIQKDGRLLKLLTREFGFKSGAEGAVEWPKSAADMSNEGNSQDYSLDDFLALLQAQVSFVGDFYKAIYWRSPSMYEKVRDQWPMVITWEIFQRYAGGEKKMSAEHVAQFLTKETNRDTKPDEASITEAWEFMKDAGIKDPIKQYDGWLPFFLFHKGLTKKPEILKDTGVKKKIAGFAKESEQGMFSDLWHRAASWDIFQRYVPAGEPGMSAEHVAQFLEKETNRDTDEKASATEAWEFMKDAGLADPIKSGFLSFNLFQNMLAKKPEILKKSGVNLFCEAKKPGAAAEEVEEPAKEGEPEEPAEKGAAQKEEPAEASEAEENEQDPADEEQDPKSLEKSAARIVVHPALVFLISAALLASGH